MKLLSDAEVNEKPKLLSDAEVTAAPPKLLSDAEVSTGSSGDFLDHMGDLLKNSPMIGTIQPDMIPSNAGEQLAIGANQGLYNAPMTFFRERVLDEEHRNTPENLAALEQLKMDRLAAGQVIREAQAPDNAVGKLAGDALQSLPGSAVSLVPMAMGAPLGAGMALGLGANMVLETAGDYTHRRDDFGQSPAAAESAALRHGAVATALEAVPMWAGMKYLTKAMPGGKALATVGAGEFAQEGLTQLHDDLSTNLEGLTNLSPGDIALNAGKAGATGMIMAPMMGPGAKLVQAGRMYGAKKELENQIKAQQTLLEAGLAEARDLEAQAAEFQATQVAALGGDPLPVLDPAHVPLTRKLVQDDGSLVEVPYEPTPQDIALAKIQRTQVASGLDVAPTPAGKQYAAEMAFFLNQGDSQQLDARTQELADEGGVSAAVQVRRMLDENLSSVPTHQKPIVYSSDQRALGLNLEQTGAPSLNSVTVVGKEGENYPAEIITPLAQMYEQWVQKYLPNARVVIDLARLPNDAYGNYKPVLHADGTITHVIRPMDMLSYGRYGVANPRVAMQLMTSASHEFGHALVQQALPDGLKGRMDEGLRIQLMREMHSGEISPEVMAALNATAPVEGALVGTWAKLNSEIRSGKLSAQQFVEHWAGTRKQLHGMQREKGTANSSLYQWARERMGSPEKPGSIEGVTALELLTHGMPVEEIPGYLDSTLSLHEFMAEQFSKYVYKKGELEASPFGAIFKETLAKMRALFRELKTWRGGKGERLIPPEKTFESWVQDLLVRNQGITREGTGKFKLAPKILKAQKKLVKENEERMLPEIRAVVAPAPPPEGQVPAPKQGKVARVKSEKFLEATIGVYEENGWLRGADAAKAWGMLDRGQLMELQLYLEGIAQQHGKDDRDYTSKVLKRLPDKPRIKAETLKATIARQDTKEAERKMWEVFLLEHPDGFTLDEAKAAVAESVMPLEPIYSEEYATVGLDKLGLSPHFGNAVSVIYTSEANFGTENHFNEPYYVMHSRRFDENQSGWRYILEMQSDLFQKGEAVAKPDEYNKTEVEASDEYITTMQLWLDEVNASITDGERRVYPSEKEIFRVVGNMPETRRIKEEGDTQFWAEQLRGAIEDELRVTAQVRQKYQQDLVRGQVAEGQAQSLSKFWEERIIKEELAQAVEDGRTMVLFPTADTLALIEGWPGRDQIEGIVASKKQRLVRLELDMLKLETEAAPGGSPFKHRDIQTQIESTRESIKRLEQTLARMGENPYPLQVMPVYKRYKDVITKYLKKNYNAVESELGAQKWLVVYPQNVEMPQEHWDRDNPYAARDPQIVLDEFAGMTPEEYRVPERVAEAQGFWQRLGTDSPYFKRWGGNTKVVGADGKPLLVWRGSGSPVAFLDPTTRGGNTGVSSAKKAFWFSDNKDNAMFYAGQAVLGRTQTLKEEHRRDAQKLRQSIAQATEVLENMPGLTPRQYETLRAIQRRDQKALAMMMVNPEMLQPTQPTVRGHYLNIVNPWIVESSEEFFAYDNRRWTQELDYALANGHDGVIFRQAYDPYQGDIYAVFSPEQVKADSNMGTFDPTDDLHWDRDSPTQQATRDASKLVQRGWDRAKLMGLNLWAKATDNLVQLQQMAASQPEDDHLARFMRVGKQAESLKNHLMGQAEDTAKQLMSVVGSSPRLRAKLHSMLKAEWKEGVLMGDLVGLDAHGQVVFGHGLQGAAALQLVRTWEVRDSLGLRQFFQKQGIDPTAEDGKKLMKMYLAVRNTINRQFYELGKALEEKVIIAYATAPTVRDVERYQIQQLIFKQVSSPFVPVGHFGNHVLIVKRGRETIHLEHFESKTDFDLAHREALALARNDLGVVVKSKHLQDEERGIPMQLPKELFEKVAATGAFTDAEIELLKDVMKVGKYERINERYEKLSKQVKGGNEDFGRVFADFSWHNSNYIWKMRYRAKLQDVLTAGRLALGRMGRDVAMPAAELAALIDRKQRNLALMERQMNYMLLPQFEFQTLRGYISLVYLAFGVKTALMNASTQMNTMAAVTLEYGEGTGLKHYGKAWKNFWRVHDIAERRRAGEVVALTPEQQKAGYEPLVYAMTRAMDEGLIDQSFAYFLAGQANADTFMKSVQGSTIGRLGQMVLEKGMMPFQTMEKLNRIIALLTFFSADVEANKAEGSWKNLAAVYEKAAKRVDQTQNAYDAMNRAGVLQGRKAILTMFMSYSLFSAHVMTGGLDRAIRADVAMENKQREALGHMPKAMPSMMRSATMKLWLMYLVLAGGLGLPFAENLLDLVRLLWGKLWPGEDPEVEAMQMLKELGADPNLILHGVMHDVWGFSLSASMGLGRLIPGTNLLGKNYRTAEEAVGKATTGLSGPAGNFLGAIVKASMELGKGHPVEAAKMMPGALGAVSKAIDATIAQANRPTYGVTTKNGMRLTMDPNTGEYRDLTTSELVGMALGFNPTILKENRDARFMATSAVLYWQIRRADLMDNWREARTTFDEIGMDSARTEIQKFNDQVPSPKLKIHGKDLHAGWKTHQKAIRAEERFGAQSKMYRSVGNEVRETYLGGE